MEASRGVRSVSGRLVSFRLDVSRRLMASRGVSGGQGSLVSSLRQAGGVRPASKGKSSLLTPSPADRPKTRKNTCFSFKCAKSTNPGVSLVPPYRWHRIVADTGSGAKRTNPLSQKGRRTNQHGRSPIPWAQKGGQTGSHGRSPVPWTSNGRRTGPHGRSPIP